MFVSPRWGNPICDFQAFVMTSSKDLAELEQLPLAELKQVNVVCDRFAEAYARGDSVRIEDFVERESEHLQPTIAVELVRLEVELRLGSGEQPSAAEYSSRFPHLADRIARAVEEITTASNDARHIDTVSLNVSDTDHRSIRSDSTAVTEVGGISPRNTHFDHRVGNRLAHYEFRERIGAGGMGVVMRAYDVKLDRDVAIKVLAADLSRDEEARVRFLREAKVAAAVRHPRVVTIHAVDECDGVPYLVMEFVDGQSLEQLIRSQGRLPVQQVVWIGQQIAEGLAAAHQRGLVHRDVKPANVLLENLEGKIAGEVLPVHRLLPSECHVKLTDFGLARAVAGIGLTKTGAIIGTPQYMSPEQAEGEEIDHRSDLFSLGSVMYSMCAGRPAFHGESVPGILRQVADKRPVSLSELGPQIPVWLVAIIDKLMAKRPADRYQTASEVARLLKRRFDEMNSVAAMLRNAQTSADDIPTQPNPVFRQPRRKLRLLLGLLATLLIALAIFIVVTKDGEFVLETTDPTIAARLGETGGIVVEDQLTNQTYTLRRGSNPMPQGEHHLLITTPSGLELETPKFTITRFGSTTATVRLKPGAGDGQIPNQSDAPTSGPDFALEFDGKKSHVKIPTLRHDASGPLTVEAWVSGSVPVLPKAIVVLGGKARAQLNNWRDGWYAFDPRLEKSDLGSVSIDPTKWVHLSYVMDTNEGRFYVDGKLISSSPRIGPLITDDPKLNCSWLGGHPELATPDVTQYVLAGQIDEVRISNVSRYSQPFSPPARFESDAQTIALYHFNEGQGDILRDSSGNQHHGQIIGARWIDRATASPPVAISKLSQSPNSVAATNTTVNESFPASSPTGILLSTGWEWTPPERLAQVNSDDNDTSPSISADGLTLVFASTRGEVRIWQSTRKSLDEPFTEPVALSEVINSRTDGRDVYFGTPHLSSDGLSLLFSSNRMGGYGWTDLWVSRRPSLDAEWQDPSNLGTGVNTPRLEYTPFVSHDGLSLFWFCPQPNDIKAGDIWTSHRESITDEFGPRKFVRAGVNTPESEQSPCLSADGLTLLFHRGSSDPRLWQATRKSVDDEFGVATQLVLPGEWANLNAHCPTLTADGKTLVFCSNREPGEQGFATGDLWITRRVSKK
jgi:serine/threonine protein kinase